MYWRSGKYGLVQYPDFGKVTGIKERRFKEIISALQFTDPSKVTPEVKLQHKGWKVILLTQAVQNSFQAVLEGFIAGEFLSLDEAMSKCTAKKNPIKKVVSGKPIPLGLKFFVLVDYTTGIILVWESDEGQYSREDYGHLPWGSNGQVVLSLVEKYRHTNRCIITDNYYTSVCLSKELLRRGLYHIGTCQLRKGIPDCVKISNTRPTRTCPKGTFNLAVSTTGGLKVAAIGVMDNAACYFLDSKYGHDPFAVN